MSLQAVAVAALVDGNRILLIKRTKPAYVGYWSLPGGKVEKNEHVSDAAVREVLEECGITAEVKGYLGSVSEHLVESGSVLNHFLLHFYELSAGSFEAKQGDEGLLGWFDLTSIESIKDRTIPSDYLMIVKMLKEREKNYYNCVIEKCGENHVLRKFE